MPVPQCADRRENVISHFAMHRLHSVDPFHVDVFVTSRCRVRMYVSISTLLWV